MSILPTSGNIRILDNEASSSLKQGFIKNNSKYQLVIPHLHRRNAPKRGIQKFKANFITCLCADNPEYPAKEWDCLLLQATLTLNFLQNCCVNPKLSAYVALRGMFGYNKTPLASLGNRVLAHKNTTNHRTWAPRGTDGCYIGPSLEHYRCVEFYIPSTHRTRISDTVEFIYTVIPITKTNSEDCICQSIADTISLLADPKPTVPSLSFGGDTQNAFKKLQHSSTVPFLHQKPSRQHLILLPLSLHFHHN